MKIIQELFSKTSSSQPDINHLNIANRAYTFLNPVSYLIARKSPNTYTHFSFLFADGWLLVAVLRLIGIRTQRYSFDMTSLAPIVFNEAIERQQSVYFIGTKPGLIDKFISVIRINFPELTIQGYQHGYFYNKLEREATIQKLVNNSPDIVVVGMGVPLQENFMVDLIKAGWSGTGFTCGGFMHQSAERLYFYPDWVNKLHLRMPYRLFKEPHFRYRIFDYFKFLIIFLTDYIAYLKIRK